MTIPYDSVLFDFDGVIADTEPIHWACWVEILQALSIELPWEVYAANCIGVQDQDMLPFLASLANPPAKAGAVEPYFSRKKDLFRRRVVEASPISQEMIQLIGSLTGYKLGLVTSSDKLEVEPILERAGIRGNFLATVFGGDVERHKPDPEPYLLAASRLDARRPLVVEDSSAGVASAEAAKFDVIRVPTTAWVPTFVRERLKF